MSRRNIIKCPNCQQEYMPGEIYYPKEFLGQPKYIVRDIYGCILGNEGIEQNTTETFCCENCNTLIDKIIVNGRGTFYCPKCQK